MVEMIAEQAIEQFASTYERLHQRWPDELRAVDQRWVVLDGVRMTTSELLNLCEDMQRQYEQLIAQRRQTVNRLVAWLSQ